MPVLTLYVRSLTRQLPFNVPYIAKVALIEQTFTDWGGYCKKCFSTIYEATLEELHQLVQSHFGSFAGTPLPDHVRMILEEQVG
jgi:hypothetical protein